MRFFLITIWLCTFIFLGFALCFASDQVITAETPPAYNACNGDFFTPLEWMVLQQNIYAIPITLKNSMLKWAASQQNIFSVFVDVYHKTNQSILAETPPTYNACNGDFFEQVDWIISQQNSHAINLDLYVTTNYFTLITSKQNIYCTEYGTRRILGQGRVLGQKRVPMGQPSALKWQAKPSGIIFIP